MLSAGSTTLVVTGKRKRQNLVLHLSGGSTCESDNDTSDFSLNDIPKASSSEDPIIINGKLVANSTKRYHCAFEGCSKAYRKPSRLEEHERVHTGERPFICLTCQKSYFRDSHLQAHARSHLPESARPFACSLDICGKRFWTIQHLKRHESLHWGEKPFKCSEPGCSDFFSKHNLLRSHISIAHCPPGTKAFRCGHEGCTKSFATNQKLNAHAKTHEEHRYTCSHSTCLQREAQEFFSRWTELQAHMRTAHPPTCPYASCNGKIFTQQKGLRAHLKLHQQRDLEVDLEKATREEDGEADDECDDRPVKRRRGGEVGRDWQCKENRCDKEFKSKKALATHVKVTHLRQRDFICSADGCGMSFGYKHLLQRHTAKAHSIDADFLVHPADATDAQAEVSAVVPPEERRNTIDILTGKSYEDRARERLTTNHSLACPHPDMSCLFGVDDSAQVKDGQRLASCGFAFTRAYDFRRHLSSAHGLIVDRDQAAQFLRILQSG